MKTIYKYPLIAMHTQTLELPKGSSILSVMNQFDEIVIYALVDTEEKQTEKYTITTHGTGHKADDVCNFKFLGTVKLEDGRLMFHVFYRKDK